MARIPLPLTTLLTATLTALMAGGTLAGCSNTAKKPDPEPKYRNLGAKTDFPEFLRGTILDSVDVSGTQSLTASGYGLVVNLENTGRNDGIPTAVREAIGKNASIFGVNSALTDGPLGQLPVNQLLSDPRTAVVRVDGIVPPGARADDRIDVRVTCIDSNTTVSLARGELWQTEIYKGVVTPQSPGERVNLAGLARGPLLVNPVYALLPPTKVKDDPAARGSLRSAIVPDGGVVKGSRDFVLRVRQPSYRVSRTIEQRLNYQFRAPVAAAQDEGRVTLKMPASFRGDWPRFLGVATTLYPVGGDPAYSLDKARQLADAATASGRTPGELLAISYAWEGLGAAATPVILPLLSDPRPAVAFAAARAGAFIGQPAAVDTLVRIAGDEAGTYNVVAADTLGKLDRSADLIRKVRGLLDAASPGVRVAAYQALDKLGDVGGEVATGQRQGGGTGVAVGEKAGRIYRMRIGEQFVLDIVDAQQPPVVWASRSGTPRIAIIGERPVLKTPMLLTAFGDRLSIKVDSPTRPASVFYRPVSNRASQAEIYPELVELVARLGGERPPGEQGIYLTYGDVLAVLKKLADDGQMVARNGAPVSLVLQDVAPDVVSDAPIIPGLEARPDATADATPAEPVGTAPGAAGAASGLSLAKP